MEAKKGTAILLAILLGFWSWIYTFNRDWWKFCIGLALNAGAWLAVFALMQRLRSEPPHTDQMDDSGALLAASALVVSVFALGLSLITTWLASLFDAMVKSDSSYESAGGINKGIAILLTTFFGPFGLLYTHSKDWKKFWILNGLLLIVYILTPIFVDNDIRWYALRVIRGYATIGETIGLLDIPNPLPISLFYVLCHDPLSLTLFYAAFHASGENLPGTVLIAPAIIWLIAIIFGISRYRKWNYENDMLASNEL